MSASVCTLHEALAADGDYVLCRGGKSGFETAASRGGGMADGCECSAVL